MSTPETPTERQARISRDYTRRRDEECKDIDSVSKALKNPTSLSAIQKDALLGRPTHQEDTLLFLRALRGNDERRIRQVSRFKNVAADFTRCIPFSHELCKFSLCDWRMPQEFNSGSDANTAVELLYQEQLRLEREQGPLEAARAAVRSGADRRARSYAQRVLNNMKHLKREERR